MCERMTRIDEALELDRQGDAAKANHDINEAFRCADEASVLYRMSLAALYTNPRESDGEGPLRQWLDWRWQECTTNAKKLKPDVIPERVFSEGDEEDPFGVLFTE